jgi:putative SOS response-associated peptidase YedK
MCGRYAIVPSTAFTERFQIENLPEDLSPSYNVAPGSAMPIVVRNSPNRVVQMQWGLIPFWSKAPSTGYRTINARAETVATAPSFRHSFRKKRCLVPASAFYEWKQTARGKVPYAIRLIDTDLFAFAGLYDIWKDAEGNERKTYTIITTAPNSLVAPIHNRMPVILDRKDEDMWLSGELTDPEPLLQLLLPYPADAMEAYVVSTAVNNPKNDGEELLQPVTGDE